MNNPSYLLIKIFLLATAVSIPLATTGCGPLLRQKSFNESKEYFVKTPMENHSPDNGARASWHLIKVPQKSTPFLLKRINADDMVTSGVSIILLQAIGGKKYQQELESALDAKDWSTAPGHLEEYIKSIEPLVRSGDQGVVESD